VAMAFFSVINVVIIYPVRYTNLSLQYEQDKAI
jgi:hypothetical protein